MPPTSQRGSGQPLLRDYLVANRQQGAQQAQGMAQYLGQQQDAARTSTDAAQQAVMQQRLSPAYGTVGQVGGSVPGVNPSTPSPDMAKKVLDAKPVELTDTEAGRAATSQVNRAANVSQLATTPAGMAAVNAQRYGMGRPTTAGGSLLDAAATNYGGGQQVRAQARQGAGLREYLTGAADRGNKAAVDQANAWVAAGTPPPTPVIIAPPRTGSRPGRPTYIEGTGQPDRLRDWVQGKKRDKFDSGEG